MDYSMSGFPVLYCLLEVVQTHVHWEVMPSNQFMLCQHSSPALIFPSIGEFSNELVLHIRRPKYWGFSFSISSVQLLSSVQLFVTPWTAACQVSLSITNSWSLLKLMSIKLVIPSNHLTLCHPLLLLPSILPRIGVFSKESFLCIRWPKYWSFGFHISPSNEYSGLISLGWTGWISLQSKGLSRVFSNTTDQKHQFLSTQLSLWSNSHIHTWPLEKP